MPRAPSSFLFLVVRPGAPSSVLAPKSMHRGMDKTQQDMPKVAGEEVGLMVVAGGIPVWVRRVQKRSSRRL